MNGNMDLKQKLLEEGIEANPGPSKEKGTEKSKKILIEIGNVSHLGNNSDLIIKRACQYFLGQEHSTLPKDRADTKAMFKDWQIHMSNLDPEADTNLAGVFMMNKVNKKVITPKVRAPSLIPINGEGGCQLYALEVDKTSIS